MEGKELLPGTLEMLILKTLSRGPNHGYGIAQHIQSVSADALKIGEGSLYPALQRLLVNDWVEAEWGVSDTNRKARIYKLTPRGPQAPGGGTPHVRRDDPGHRPRDGGMNAMRLWNKIRARFGRGVDGDLAEEMRLHREMLEERFRAEGFSADEARIRAAREFGPAVHPLEDSRAEWSFAWLELS